MTTTVAAKGSIETLRKAKSQGRGWRRANKTQLMPIGGAIVVFIVWEIAVRVMDVPHYLLPAPSVIAQSLVENAQSLAGHLATTATAAGTGFVVAFGISVVFGVAISESKLINQVAYPWLVVVDAIPKAAVAPLFLVWFGFGMASNVMFVVTFCVFPLVVSIVSGLSQADPEQVQLARIMGAGRFRVFRMIRVPMALPQLFVGIRISATSAPVGAVIGEFVASNSGIGYVLIGAIGNLDTARAFSAVVIVSVFGVAIWYVVMIAERLLMPWHVSQRA